MTDHDTIQYHRILVSTDFSETAQAAVDYALSLPLAENAEILLVHTVEPLTYPMYQVLKTSGSVSYEDQVTKACRESLADIIKSIDSPARIHPVLLEGRPATEICKLAEQEAVDLIVIGSHGRSGIRRAVLGSVAEGIMRHCECPVLVVKQS